jgi:glycosyltransferase involved in cell wall biosynthesis
MELFLFEPQLRSNGSHYLNYAVDIGNAAAKKGYKTKVFADCRIETEALQVIKKSNIEVLPIFPSFRIFRIRIRAIIWPAMAFIYAWKLVKYTKDLSGSHIVCTVSGTIEYLSGISLAILAGFFRAKIIMQMYSWENREDTSATPKLIRLYRYITERLAAKAIDKGNLILSGQGKQVAEHVSRRLNRPVHVLPFATDWSRYKKNGSNNCRLRIGFLGVMRAEKGFRQFVEAVEKINANVEIIVQAQLPTALGETDAEGLIRSLKKNRRCRVIEGEMNTGEYRKVLSEIDIIILPYRPNNFFRKTSNIFSESVGLGKVIVAPRATLMGKMLALMNIGVTYSPYSSKALQDAIETAVSNFQQLHQKAGKAANDWREKNSADSFLEGLIMLGGG